MAKTTEPTHRKPLRLWPGVVAAGLLLLVRLGVPTVAPGYEGFGVATLGGLLCVLAIVTWWAFFSRASRSERWGALVLIVVALVVTWRLNHESMKLMWGVYYAVPVLSLALVAWTAATHRLADGQRRAALVAIVLLACSPWTLVRMKGLTGDHVFQFAWRWTETREERFLARADEGRTDLASAPAMPESRHVWPGFRGSNRDGVISGVRIESDWARSPPIELWRRPLGPGWSSFAVNGDLLYTQEQRGEDEVVACYDATTGEPVWTHRDTTRFYEAMGGVGPRATPAFNDDRVYTLGATGILNALDAADGTVAWMRNVASDTGSRVPVWGFSSSPLVAGDVLVVAAGGALVGYDTVTGDPRWLGPDGGASYSSPHRATIAGLPQVLLLSDAGVTSVAPADGRVLWEHAWPGASLVQPALTADGDVLINAGEGKGIRRIGVARGPGGWTIDERWESNRLKPNFNDFVVHDGYAYGFDGSILASIDLADGERRWKGGRYGHGQLVLLADQDLLLVLSEKGELALVEAVPERFTELARLPAIEGKTWNHPALVADLLLVRNDREMAAFRLPLADG